MLRDQLDRAVQVTAGFVMHAYPVRSGVAKCRDKFIGILDHQVAIEGKTRDLAQRLDDRRSERNVRHKVPIHYVDMDDRATAALCSRNFVCETSKIRRKYRWSQLNHDTASVSSLRWSI